MKALLNILLVALLFSCKEDKVPEGILPLDKMSSLVEDISVLEAHFQSLPRGHDRALSPDHTILVWFLLSFGAMSLFIRKSAPK